MQTLVLQEPGHLTLTETSFPQAPGPGEALVRVHRVGVCGTDLHAYRGKQPFFSYPRILGHELGVEVLAVDDPIGRIRVGDRCAVEPYLNCGRCVACRRGKTNCCATLNVLGVHGDGGMREQLLVPAAKLHPSARLDYDALALVETLAIGAHAVSRAALQPEDTVLVIGAGPIGLSVIEFVKLAGVSFAVADRSAARLAFCRQALGVQTALDADEALAEKLTSHWGDLPTVVIDATGNPASMMSAFQYVAQGGKLVYVGLFQGDVSFHDPLFHRKELTLLASRNALAADFTAIIGHLEAGRIDTCPWITHRATLTETPQVFPAWLEPETGVIKAMLTI